MSTPSIFEYLPEEASVIWKMAEAEPSKKPEIKNPIAHGLRTVGEGLALMGVGTLAGYGAGVLAGDAYKAVTGKTLPPAALRIPTALAGAGLNIAYRNYKTKELEELRRAAESYRNRAKRSVPR